MTLPATDPRAPRPVAADVLLSDGSVAVLRPIVPEDRVALDELHAGVSDASARLRFFASGRQAGHDYVAHLFDEASTDTVAALVLSRHGRVLALATAEGVDTDTAEVAFLVADELRGHGAGSLLLEHLAALGRQRGVRRFVAEVLAENRAMLDVMRDAGFAVVRSTDGGTVHLELATTATPQAVAAADEREFRSEARSLEPLLHPRRVALVGARRDGSGVGAAVLASIQSGDYAGDLVVVHPSATEVAGVTAYPRLVDVPERPDLVIVTVPAARVLETLRDAVEAGVPAAVVISSGFEELGADGALVQREMLRLARDNSIRLVGPNCLGVMANRPDIRLNATFTPDLPPPGGLALASQSGGVGIALMDVARELGLGVGSFISLGNKADVSGNDLLSAWLEDDTVTAAALYLESFGNAAKFARVARSFAERKPLLAVVGGRSAGGRRAGASHTAAAAAPGVGVDALFAQSGVIGCQSAEEMAEAALLLDTQPLPDGPRLAVLSNAGGMGVLAADAADERGLVVPELSPTLRDAIGRHVLGTTGTSNPIDAGAGASADDIAAITDALLASDEVDALLVVLVRTGVTDPGPLLEALAGSRQRRADKPFLLVSLGGLSPDPATLPGITLYRSAAAAVRALTHGVQHAAWRRVPRAEPPTPDDERARTARARAEMLMASSGGGWLEPDQADGLLGLYGLATAGRLAHDPLGASRAAEELGFPVAVKVADRTVVHKSDRGLVRVGLRSAAEVLSAVRAFETELGHGDVPVLVQPVVTGVEVALGVVRDPGFGPLVMVAAGGTATDLWDDRAFLLPPIGEDDAVRALRSLRIWPLLDGFRGSPPVDVASLQRLIVALGALAADVPQVAELDLNPVLVGSSGCDLVDVKVRLAEGVVVDAGIPRQLRRRP